MRRTAAYNQDALIIMMLRQPAFRAYSHWRMEVARSNEHLPFREAIRDGRSRVSASPNGVHRVYSYVERRFYSQQISRILNLFPQNQVMFIRTDQLWTRPTATLQQIGKLLSMQVPPSEVETRHVSPIASQLLVVMSLADRSYLDDLYAADVEATAQLTGLDLDD